MICVPALIVQSYTTEPLPVLQIDPLRCVAQTPQVFLNVLVLILHLGSKDTERQKSG